MVITFDITLPSEALAEILLDTCTLYLPGFENENNQLSGCSLVDLSPGAILHGVMPPVPKPALVRIF